MRWDEVRERILKENKDGTLTWEDVKKQVKKENEDEEKKNKEIRKQDAEESVRLWKKSKFVTNHPTNHSITFTRDEYDKLKTAFCRGKGWSLDYPHTVNVHSITLTGSYKWMPGSDVGFRIEIEEQGKDPRTEGSNNDTKIDIEKENLKA